MLDLRQLLRVRSAYAGRFDASGNYLAFVSDLAGVPQVWAVGQHGWPELLVAPPDRAQTIYAGPRPGQLAVGADIGGDEHTQLLYVDRPGVAWRALTDARAYIHNFGSFSSDGKLISFASNTRADRWFDIYVHDLESGDTRRVLEHDSSNRAGPFSPDGRWLVTTRSFSNSHQELWLVDLYESSPPRLLTPAGEEAVYEHVAWAPDGQALYYVSDQGHELAAPARIDLAGGQLTYIVEPDFDVDEAALDPTGRRLAYVLNRDGEGQIVIRNLNTGAEELVTGLPPGALYQYWQGALAWDPRGERLAISWTGSRVSQTSSSGRVLQAS